MSDGMIMIMVHSLPAYRESKKKMGSEKTLNHTPFQNNLHTGMFTLNIILNGLGGGGARPTQENNIMSFIFFLHANKKCV